MKKVIFRTTLTLFSLFLVWNMFLIKTDAVEVASRDIFGLDESLTQQTDSFGLASSILVTPIFLDTDTFTSDADWYRGLYYYQTSRLSQGDFTFHYVTFKDGTIAQGNSGGEDQRIIIDETNGGSIIIAYLARKGDIDFEKEAKIELAELILGVANNQNISLDDIFVSGVEFIAKEDEAVKMQSTIIGGRWERSMSEIIDSIEGRYKPVKKEYKIEVASIKLPSKPVKYGDDVVIELTVKNNSKYALFQGTDAEPLISKLQGDISNFYVNEEWLSLTQAPIMDEGNVIKPGEEGIFKLKIGVPLYFGKQSEDFQLIDSLGKPYPSTRFKLSLDVERLNKEVIEVLSTETGQLNVRKQASGFSDIFARVSPGQRFVVLARDGAGWVKIDLGNNKSGWVSQQYTKVI